MRREKEHGWGSPPVDGFRTLRAVAIVFAILLVVPGVDSIIRFFNTTPVANAADLGIDANYLTGAWDVRESLNRIEELAVAEGADVPETFAEEVGFLPDARNIRANSDGSVVGYTVPRDCDETIGLIAERMESAGWTTVSLGTVEGATFVKTEGMCRWALITCTQVGSATSVVVRSVVE